MRQDKDLLEAIKGRKKNPRVGIRRPDQEGLVVRVGFRSLTDDERRVIVKWYRSGYFTQEELASMFGISSSIVNKAVRAFTVEAKASRLRLAGGA